MRGEGELRNERGENLEGRVCGDAWKKALPLAKRQRGVVSRDQLFHVGLTRNEIDGLIKRHHLHRLHRGIYLVGHEALAPLAREWAAILACGAPAHISHTSAAAIWTPSVVRAPRTVEVTVTGKKGRSRPRIRAHTSEPLHKADLRNIDGLPLTAPARTLIDVVAAGFERGEELYSEMLSRRLLRESDVVAALERAPRRRGMAELRGLIEMHHSGFTRSKAERLMRRLCKEAQLPQPLTNVPLEGVVADVFWPAARLIVEVDGFLFHRHRAAFERDRRRDAKLVAAGFVVIRVTWRQLNETPLAVVATIAPVLVAGTRGARVQH